MDSFEFNKIAGAVLIAALVAFGLGALSDFIFEDHQADSPGYIIEVAETSGGEAGGEAPAAEAASAEVPAAEAPVSEATPAEPAVSPVLAMVGQMSAEDGKKVAKKCLACHAFDEGGKNKVGPPLWGILNRAAGAADGFRYSAAMKDFGENGGSWDYATLDAYLADPKGNIPGNKMSFAGLKKEKDRAAILAYLRTLASEPAPLP